MTDPKIHFVVSRLTWRNLSGENVLVRRPGESRVAAFADFTSAEADRASREQSARTLVNPFRCGTVWGERSHMPEPVFRDFIKDVGIEPPTLVPIPTTDEVGQPLSRPTRRLKQREATPPGTFRDWSAWWDAIGPTLSAEQVGRVWEGLDRVRFFRVEERPVRAVGFVVVEVEWIYNDEWYHPLIEGGMPLTAYRTRERAEAECARLNSEARERWRRDLHLPSADAAGFAVFLFDMQNRPFPGDDPLGPRRKPPERANARNSGGKFSVDEVPFYEVVELELAVE